MAVLNSPNTIYDLFNINFENNQASWGGGIFSDLSGNITLQEVIFTNNIAFDQSGGAICFY
jgi:predicted outer membrane repeat protein